MVASVLEIYHHGWRLEMLQKLRFLPYNRLDRSAASSSSFFSASDSSFAPFNKIQFSLFRHTWSPATISVETLPLGRFWSFVEKWNSDGFYFQAEWNKTPGKHETITSSDGTPKRDEQGGHDQARKQIMFWWRSSYCEIVWLTSHDTAITWHKT